MKIINSSFQEVQDPDNLVSDSYNQVIDFLKAKIDDEQLMNRIISNLNNSIVQLSDGKSYTILTEDGNLFTKEFSSGPGAVTSNMVTSVDEKKVTIIQEVVLRPATEKHHLIHELLHIASSDPNHYFDENGIFRDKVGTKVTYYDKDFNKYVVDNNPSSDGLNEGITEILKKTITNEYTGAYVGQCIVANLLMSCNDRLLKAYFSSDLRDLESFYNDLEEKQSIITRDDLCNFASNTFNEDEIIKLIVGAIKYNMAFNNTVDLARLVGPLEEYYMLDSGTWYDLINDTLKKYDENDVVTSISM